MLLQIVIQALWWAGDLMPAIAKINDLLDSLRFRDFAVGNFAIVRHTSTVSLIIPSYSVSEPTVTECEVTKRYSPEETVSEVLNNT